MKAVVAVVIGLLIAIFLSRNPLLVHGARNGQTALISIALALRADKNGYSRDGSTPLIAAADAGQSKAVDRLIAAGADVNRQHRITRATPLMIAAGRGESAIVDSLLAAGASVSIRDTENNTAYTYAFRNNRFQVTGKIRYATEANVALPAPSSAAAPSFNKWVQEHRQPLGGDPTDAFRKTQQELQQAQARSGEWQQKQKQMMAESMENMRKQQEQQKMQRALEREEREAQRIRLEMERQRALRGH